MSGLEVVGGLSAIINLLDASITVYDDARNDDIKLPNTFGIVRRRLPVILNVLQKCKNDLELGVNSMPMDACEALGKILDDCGRKARELREMFEKVIPGKKDTWEQQYKKVIRRPEKEDKVEELMATLTQVVQLIVYRVTVQSASQQQNVELEDIIEEMKSVDSSVPYEERSGLIFNSGGGVQKNNVNSGSGQQIDMNFGIQTVRFGNDYEKALDSEDLSTLDEFNNLGNLYRHQGKLRDAEAMYQRALAGYETSLGLNHISTLNAVNNLGLLYSDQGKLKEAKDMYERALVGKQKALGPEHTSTLNTINNLGNLYRSQGKLKEAEAMYRRALAGYEKALGPDHTSTQNTVNNLHLLHSDQGGLKGVRDVYERAPQGGSISYDAKSSYDGNDQWTTFSETISLSSNTDVSLPSGLNSYVFANTNVTSNGFQPHLHRLFKQYGTELEEDAVSQSEKMVAKAVHGHSGWLAKQVNLALNMVDFKKSRIMSRKISAEAARQRVGKWLVSTPMIEKEQIQEPLQEAPEISKTHAKDDPKSGAIDDAGIRDASDDEDETSPMFDSKTSQALSEADRFLVSTRAYQSLKDGLNSCLKLNVANDDIGSSEKVVKVFQKAAQGPEKVSKKMTAWSNLTPSHSRYQISFRRSLLAAVLDSCKWAVRRIVGCQLSWWPWHEPEEELRVGHTRVYSMAFRGRRFYNDIPIALSERIFPELCDTRSSARKATLSILNQESIFLHDTTLMNLLLNCQSPKSRTKGTGEGQQSTARKDAKLGVAASSGVSVNQQEQLVPTREEMETISDHTPHQQNLTPAEVVDGHIESSSQAWIYLCVDIGRNQSRARAVKLGKNDKETFENIRTNYHSFTPKWCWWKRATNIRFYRFQSFLFKDPQNCHYIHLHRDKERYPEAMDPVYAEYCYTPRPWPSFIPYPSHEAWHYFEHPVDCGTSSDMNNMLPVRSKNSIPRHALAFGMHFEERYSALAIFVVASFLCLLTLAGTLWFIPGWLGEHPGDLQNATTPLVVAFAVVNIFISLATSLLIFRLTIP